MSAARKPRAAGFAKKRPAAISVPRYEATGPRYDDAARPAWDAERWAAGSGRPAAEYPGMAAAPFETPELRARAKAAGEALTACPCQAHADQLLRITHECAFGRDPGPGRPEWDYGAAIPIAAPRKPLQADPAGEWWAGSGDDRKAVSDDLTRFAEEAGAALAESDWQPEDSGEVARGEAAREWWE
jgi:hypothetical protein